MNAANNTATDSAAVDEYYGYETLAATGQTPTNGSSPLTGIDSNVSINDNGTMGFVGLFSGGQAILVNDGTALRSINPGLFRSSVSFAPAVQINNQQRVIGRQLVAGVGGVPPRSFIRSWDATTTDSFVTVASGGASSDFDNVFSFPTINNSVAADTAFSAQDGGANVLVASSAPGVFDTVPLANPLRPRIASDGQVVVRAGNLTSSPIRLYAGDLSTFVTIGGSSTGFTSLGIRPGISDDGTVIAFAGDRGSGDAIFVSIDDGTGSRSLLKVAGEAWDGAVCGRSELGIDAVNAPVCFRSFDRDGRVSVQRVADPSGDRVLVSFIGTPSAAGPSGPAGIPPDKGLWTRSLLIRPAPTFPTYALCVAQSVAQVGEVINGRTITNVAADDALGLLLPGPGSHQVGFWVSTDAGDTVLRARHLGKEDFRVSSDTQRQWANGRREVEITANFTDQCTGEGIPGRTLAIVANPSAGVTLDRVSATTDTGGTAVFRAKSTEVASVSFEVTDAATPGATGKADIDFDRHKVVLLALGINTSLTCDTAGNCNPNVDRASERPKPTDRYPDNTFDSVRTKLSGMGFKSDDVLWYSYRGGSVDSLTGRWKANNYKCVHTGQPFQESINALREQVRQFALSNPNSDFYIVGHSQGGLISFQELAFVADLPPNASLKGVITLDAPLGGSPFIHVLLARLTCWGGSAATQLQALHATSSDPTRQGSTALVLCAIPSVSMCSTRTNAGLVTATAGSVDTYTYGYRGDYVYRAQACPVWMFPPIGLGARILRAPDNTSSQFVDTAGGSMADLPSDFRPEDCYARHRAVFTLRALDVASNIGTQVTP